MKAFSFDNLGDTEFEQFCYDLLKAMGFANVNWRKGTGHQSSPADQGRDIECEMVRAEIDGTVLVERWFVECKHYKEGVPPAKIQGALAWANAERPDVLLIVASNFLSNPAKEYLKSYKENNRPSFRIKQWELPDLESNSRGKLQLLHRYRLAADTDFVHALHPAHLEYLKGMRANTLKYLFECLDAVEQAQRDEMTGWLWHEIIQPNFREPVTGKETLAELTIGPFGYDEFKRQCRQILKTGMIGETLFVSGLVSFALQAMFGYGDATSIDRVTRNLNDAIEFFTKREQTGEDAEGARRARERFERNLSDLPARVEAGYLIYLRFCEQVLAKLLTENPLS